jgi:hypothetical protein
MSCPNDQHCWAYAWVNGAYVLRCTTCGATQSH